MRMYAWVIKDSKTPHLVNVGGFEFLIIHTFEFVIHCDSFVRVFNHYVQSCVICDLLTIWWRMFITKNFVFTACVVPSIMLTFETPVATHIGSAEIMRCLTLLNRQAVRISMSLTYTRIFTVRITTPTVVVVFLCLFPCPRLYLFVCICISKHGSWPRRHAVGYWWSWNTSHLIPSLFLRIYHTVLARYGTFQSHGLEEPGMKLVKTRRWLPSMHTSFGKY